MTADIFSDGHDRLAGQLLFRQGGETQWQTRPLLPLPNDEWSALFRVSQIGTYEYTVTAWIDRFRTWLTGTEKKFKDGQDIRLEMKEGAGLVTTAADRAEGEDQKWLCARASFLASDERILDKLRMAADPDLQQRMDVYPDKSSVSSFEKVLQVTVESLRARFSSWYELFPRACSPDARRHGTFQDLIRRLPAIADMGFDVLYLPPIHPIGETNRKGPNNATAAGPEDPGSPWAIGSAEGGHRAVHPQLGSLEDFQALVAAGHEHEIEIALDLAFQTSPDHPYVREHPEWFHTRPDGSIQHAENPPKRYEDIYPFDFESQHADALCEELLDVTRFWINQGIRIFRVDNPHTKPLRFWQWLIAQIKRTHPDVIFLAEAFTRPKTMYRLAKGGFTQSYTYFTWRNLKQEIIAYMTELTSGEVAEFFWPNFWPNTPDILPEYLQLGGRPAFIARLVLAATLSSNYGIYGPAFELCENEADGPFSEGYARSEKYEIRAWDLEKAGNLRGLIKRVNRIRKENPALQQTRNLRFHPVESEEIICFSKYNDAMDNVVVTAVNLDPHHTHGAWLNLPLKDFEIRTDQPIQMHELISDARYLWHTGGNYIELDPGTMPVHIFRIRKQLKSEHDFDYFM